MSQFLRTVTFIPRVGINQDAITVPRGPFPCFDVRGGPMSPIAAFDGSVRAIPLGRSQIVVQGGDGPMFFAEIQRSTTGAAKLQARDSGPRSPDYCLFLLQHPIGTHGNKISGDHALFGNPYLPSPAIELARGVIREPDRYGHTWLLLLPKDAVLRVSTVGAGAAQTNYYLFDGKKLLGRTREQRINGDDLPGFPIPRLPRWRLNKEIVGEETFWKLSEGEKSVVGTPEDWDLVTRAMNEGIDSGDSDTIVFDVADGEYPAGLCNDADDVIDVARPQMAARWIRAILGLEVI